MARDVKKTGPTLLCTFFSSVEQKVIRLLLSEPTTAFTPRIISSRLKGIRGLGGMEGIQEILEDLCTLGMVEFVDNQRAVRLCDDTAIAEVLKIFSALCDLEGLQKLLEPISKKGVLYGSRARGLCRSDSDFDLFIVSEDEEEVRRVAECYPLGRPLKLQVWGADQYGQIKKKDARLYEKLSRGITLWGRNW